MADGGEWGVKQSDEAAESVPTLLASNEVDEVDEMDKAAGKENEPTTLSPLLLAKMSPKSPVDGAISPTKSPVSSPLEVPADDPPTLSPHAPSPLQKSPLKTPTPIMPTIVSSPFKSSAANGPHVTHSPKTPITSPAKNSLDASNAAPDHSPIEPAAYKSPKFASPAGASLSPPNQSSVSSNVSVGTSPASVVGAPRSPYDISNSTPPKETDKKSIKDVRPFFYFD